MLVGFSSQPDSLGVGVALVGVGPGVLGPGVEAHERRKRVSREDENLRINLWGDSLLYIHKNQLQNLWDHGEKTYQARKPSHSSTNHVIQLRMLHAWFYGFQIPAPLISFDETRCLRLSGDE